MNKTCITLLLSSLLLTSCLGLSEEEQAKLDDYKLNAKNYHNQGKYAQTVDQCRKGLAVDDDDYSLNLQLGTALFYHGSSLADRQERLQAIYDARDQLEKTDSMRGFFSEDDYRVHLCLGMVHYKMATEYRRQGEAAKSQLASLEASGVTGEEIGTLREKAEICEKGVSDEIDDAKSALLKVLSYERQGENLEAILYLGQVYAYSNELEKAIEELRRGLDLLESSVAFLARRLENEEMMDSQELAFYKKRLSLNEDREKELRGILANLYARTGRHDERLAQYRILEEKGFLEGAMIYNKALAEQTLGLDVEAIIDYNAFIRMGLAPDTELEDRERLHKTIENMMNILRGIENTDRIARFLAASPDRTVDLHRALSNFYYSVGEYEKCIDQFDALEEKGLMEGDLYYKRALAEQELGRYTEAILDYQRFQKEGGMPDLQLETDERFLIATRNIQECRARLDGEG